VGGVQSVHNYLTVLGYILTTFFNCCHGYLAESVE